MAFDFKIKMSLKNIHSHIFQIYTWDFWSIFHHGISILKCLCVTLTILENMGVICHQPVLSHKYQTGNFVTLGFVQQPKFDI